MKTTFRPQVDGFAFHNDWLLDQTERALILNIVDGAVGAAALALAPLYAPVLGLAVVAQDAILDGIGALFGIPPGIISTAVTLDEIIAIASGKLVGILNGWVANKFLTMDYGLCGGMAFAALDYYKLGWVVPQGKEDIYTDPNIIDPNTSKPKEFRAPRRVVDGGTPEGELMRKYIWQRLIDSFVTGNVATNTLYWMALLKLISPNSGGGTPALLSRTQPEWLTLKQHLNNGNPWPLGLVGTSDTPSDNHQVLAYGFEESATKGTIYIYDNNYPGEEQTITLTLLNGLITGLSYAADDGLGDETKGGGLKGFFCANYIPNPAPPLAVKLSSGITVVPAGQARPAQLLQFTYQAVNVGYGPTPDLALNVKGYHEIGFDEVQAAGPEAAMAEIKHGDQLPAAVSLKLEGSPGKHIFFPMCHLTGTKGGNSWDVWKVIPGPDMGTVPFVVVTLLPPRFSSAADDNSAAIAYWNTPLELHRYVFVVGENGRLYTSYARGASNWTWKDLGTPPGTTVKGGPCAVTYAEGGVHRIYAFVQGTNGRLYVCYWDGSAWRWADQGTPQGVTLASTGIGAITYLEAGTNRIYAFIAGVNGHLYVNYWDGSTWQWADQGLPPFQADVDQGGTKFTKVVSGPGVVSYSQGGVQRIYAFVYAANNDLFVNAWDGSAWGWQDLGAPPQSTLQDTTTYKNGPRVITYPEAGSQMVYAFVRGRDGNLYLNSGVLSVPQRQQLRLTWTTLGSPPNGAGSILGPAPGTLSNQREQVIWSYTHAGGHVYLNWWNGAKWTWIDKGNPISAKAVTGSGGNFVINLGILQTEIFVIGDDGHLYWLSDGGAKAQAWVDQSAI
jgi:hypothetical protein